MVKQQDVVMTLCTAVLVYKKVGLDYLTWRTKVLLTQNVSNPKPVTMHFSDKPPTSQLD